MFMGIPIPPETPDPNIDDPTLPPPDPTPDPPPVPERDPTPPGIKPPVGDPPSEEPPVKASKK
jgi:hypothetical protein